MWSGLAGKRLAHIKTKCQVLPKMAQTLIREVTWWQRVTSSLYRQSGHSRTPAELQQQPHTNKESPLKPERNSPPRQRQ